MTIEVTKTSITVSGIEPTQENVAKMKFERLSLNDDGNFSFSFPPAAADDENAQMWLSTKAEILKNIFA